MKGFFLAAIAAVTLAACGGGGSTGSPIPKSTATPVTTTSYAIKFTPNGTTRLASAMFRKPMGTGGGSDPVVLVAASLDANSFSSNWISDAPTNASNAGSVSVSPEPSATPSWQLSTTNNDATFVAGTSATATTAPNPNVFPNGVNNPGSGTVTATVGSSTTTTNVYEYGRLAFACTSVDPATYGTSSSVAQGGVQMVNGVPQPTNVLANADLYVDGPNCFGQYQNSTESEITLHCPHGCVFVSDPTQFMVSGSSVFKGSTPVTSLGTSEMFNAAAGAPGFIDYADSAGNIYKAWLDVQNVWNVPTTGPYCEFPCMDGSN